MINKFFAKKKNNNFFSLILFIFIFFIFFSKNHFIENHNQVFYSKMKLVKEIKKNYDKIDRILIPVNIPYIRMNTGLPIFIDWKHHAFKYDEIIMWKKRMNLAQKFYHADEYENQKKIISSINNIENISHILIKKENFTFECKNLINHELYVLINAKTCFQLN